ncbi:hypothetical protein BDW59DRAFT_131874 [Aspergillus cavernicola]|uniref:Peptidase S8/S53 domain-containing protein n=1 Tax=Aspergillus cavernicola TaxID=176166 RepID=A0ABR4HQN4_9EURO
MVSTMDPEAGVNPPTQGRSADDRKYDQTTTKAGRKDNESEAEDDDEDEEADDNEEEDEEDDEEDDDRQSVDFNPVHTELQGIVKSIKGFEIKNWTEHAEIFGEEATRWPHLADVSEKTGDCILHFLMRDDDATQKENKELGKAIKYITKYHPRLLTVRNKDKMTPLYLALSVLDRPRVSLIKRGLFPPKLSGKGKRRLAKAIATRCGPQDENCLHLALKNQFRDSSLLELMVQNASQDAINARDNGNWTPLHRAVHYRHAGEDTFNIIQELIARGEPSPEPCGIFDAPQAEYAFDAYVTVDREELSVYEYHMKTRDRMTVAAASINPTQGNDRKEATKVDKKELHVGERQMQDPKKAAANAQRMNARDRANMSATRMVVEAREEAKEEDWPKPGLVRANTFQRRTESRKKNPKSENEQEIERLEQWSEQIRQELKLHCLRTRTIAQADRFLHGSNKEGIQLYFDYNGLPTENADPVTFYDNFKGTRFDEVLQYVEFPAVRLRRTDIPRGETFQRHKGLFQSKAGGRKDLLFFFSWLKDKKVKHIINLVVHDPIDSHDDEAIETCLSGFRIDVLDWSKPDLDPEMLCSACPDVKELHLRWGGNNAILRAWGEPEGLRTLKNLEQIYLYYDETSDRSRSKIERFAARFKMPVSASGPARMDDGPEDNESMVVSTTERERPQNDQPVFVPEPRIKVLIGQSRETFPGAGATTSEVAVPDQATVTVHKWLESIDSFTDELKTLMANIRTNSHRGDEIRVALIDDGVDFSEKEFREKIMHGKSFAYHTHGNQREKQWYVSELGHGTVMAHMILRVCPMAKIYPIKLDTIRDPKTKHADIRPYSAIQAIEAAVEKDVHIISMSWTVEQPKGDAKTAFDMALKKAEEKGILMFCSSPDEGIFSSDHYPTAWGPDKFFRIGASQADGNPYGRVLLKQVDYLFPGVDVVRANKRDIKLRVFEDNNSFTGSSVSTALAAGLAALVLWFAIIGAKYSWDENQNDGLDNTDVKKLQGIKAMKQAFQNLGAGRDSNDKFVEIWSVLEKPAQSLKDHRGHAADDIKESRRIIFNLARDLVTKS